MNHRLTSTRLRPAVAGSGTAGSAAAEDLQIGPASTSAWRHTLILTGTLNAGSALDLQEEVECLSQEGVTNIVLDLRRLQAIDTDGEQAIASLPTLYQRRGPAIAVIGGATLTTHTPLRVGNRDVRMIGRPRFGLSGTATLPARSTEMVKAL